MMRQIETAGCSKIEEREAHIDANLRWKIMTVIRATFGENGPSLTESVERICENSNLKAVLIENDYFLHPCVNFQPVQLNTKTCKPMIFHTRPHSEKAMMMSLAEHPGALLVSL